MSFKDTLKDDLATFLNPDEFAEVALFSRSGLEINVILDKEIESETGKVIDIMTVKVSDIVDIAVNDTFTIGSTVFTFISKFPSKIGELMVSLRVQDGV